MSEWKEYRIGDIGNFSYGKMPKKDKLNTGDYPTFSGYKYQFTYPEYNCKKNDLIVVARGVGGTGDVKVVKEDCYLTNLSLKMDFDTNIVDKTFVFYYYFKDTLRYLDSGSAQSQITINDLSDAFISLPPLKEQKAIAEVLSSLDDKIDLLHSQNKTLEELAQTLFRQWFIEEAKDDWEVGTLDDIMNFNPTHSIKKGFLSPFLEMKNVQTNKSSVADWYKREFTSGTKFKNDDTLLSRITPSLENGKTAYVDFLKKDEIGWGSTEFIVMRMKNSFHPFISYLVARNKDFRKFAIGNMTGSTGRQRVQAQDIKMYEIAIPPIEEIKKLNIVIEPIPIKIKSNSKQIKTLENMRDTLLPKLMSGEVRIKYE